MEIEQIIKYKTSTGEVVDNYTDAQAIEVLEIAGKMANDVNNAMSLSKDDGVAAGVVKSTLHSLLTPHIYVSILKNVKLEPMPEYFEEHPEWERIERTNTVASYRHVEKGVIAYQDTYEKSQGRWSLKRQDTDLVSITSFKNVLVLEIIIEAIHLSE